MLSAIIRRWYIIISLLIATVAAAATVGSWVKPEYATSAVISVLPGPTTVQARANVPQVANPYLSGAYTAGILQYALSSSSVQQDLRAAGLTGVYEIKPVPRSSFIGIGVTANDPQVATATAHGVIDRARRILAKRQSAIPGLTTRVTIDVLDNGDNVSVSTSGHLQALVAVLGAGCIVSVIVTVLIDDLLLLRRRRDREADVEMTSSSNGVVGAAGKVAAPGTRADR